MSKRKETVVKPPSVSGRDGGAASGADLKRVRDLARIANEQDLAEIEVGPDGYVRIARAQAREATHRPSFGSVAGPVALVPPLPNGPDSAGAGNGPAASEGDDGVMISSPFVGTFYRAASPENDPFVEIGQAIRKGQVVCIVEAMKLMNEIEAEADGKLAEILVKNGAHVQYGQPLFRLAKM